MIINFELFNLNNLLKFFRFYIILFIYNEIRFSFLGFMRINEFMDNY